MTDAEKEIIARLDQIVEVLIYSAPCEEWSLRSQLSGVASKTLRALTPPAQDVAVAVGPAVELDG